jgi:hypothetical protein
MPNPQAKKTPFGINGLQSQWKGGRKILGNFLRDFFVHNRYAGRTAGADETMSFLQKDGTGNDKAAASRGLDVRRGRSVMDGTAPALWFEQDAFDHLGIDIVGFQVFDGGHGIAAFLDRNGMVDDVAAAQVDALVFG